jgi:hypothetical protein
MGYPGKLKRSDRPKYEVTKLWMRENPGDDVFVRATWSDGSLVILQVRSVVRTSPTEILTGLLRGDGLDSFSKPAPSYYDPPIPPAPW